MKHILKNMLCTSLLLLAVIGCGKDEKKSASNQPVAYNPYLDGNFNQTDQQALSTLTTWLGDGQPENTQYTGLMGGFKREVKNVTGFSFEVSWGQMTPTDCYIIAMDKINYAVGKPNNGICENQVSATKATNTKLINAINGESGSLKLVSIYKSGTRYDLTFIPVNGYSYNQQVIHTIDTSFPSFLNPIQTFDFRIGKKDVIKGLSSSFN